MGEREKIQKQLNLSSLPEAQGIKTVGNVAEWVSKAGLVAGGVLLGRAENLNDAAVGVGVAVGAGVLSYIASFLRNPDKIVDLLDDD